MAGRIALDLKQFKHVKSDDKTTTLQHKDGHQLVLAHKALSPEYQKQLGALSKISGENQTQTQSNEARQNFAEGTTKVTPDEQKDSMQEASNPGAGVRQYKPYDMSGDVHKPADKTNVPQKGTIQMKQPDPKNNPSGMTFAEGGEIQNPKPHGKVTVIDDKKPKSFGKILDPKGNEKPKVYAEGPQDGLVSKNDGAPVLAPEMQQAMAGQSPGMSQPQAEEQAQQQPEKVAPILQATRDKYNQLAGATPGDPNAPMVDPGMFNFGANGEPPKAFKPEVWQQAEQAVKSEAEGQQASKMQQAADIEQQNAVRARAGLPPLPVPPTPPSATASMEGQQTSPASDIPSPVNGEAVKQSDNGGGGMNDSMSNVEGMMQQGYQSKLSGIQQEAAAKGSLGQEQAKLLNDRVAAQQTAQKAYQDTYSQLEQERQAHMDDIREGHIDPDKYWTGYTDSAGNKHGGHSKIAAGIGMILAGFNPTNNPNAAINFLKHQMDNNLEAQKQNLSSEQNLLAANLKQFGNAKDAMDMTRLMQNDIMQNELAKAAANAQSPMAKAAAMQAAGQLKMDAAPIFQNFAMRRAMIGLSSNPNQSPQAIDHMLGYMRVTNPEMAKEMESRYVPGVGLASTPLPPAVREQVIAKQQFNQALNDLRQWSSAHSGSISPSAIAEGRTKAANVQNLYRQGINGGVFKQGEQSFINGIIDADPSKFFNSIRVLPKLNEAAKENEASLNILKKGYGLPVAQPQAEPVTGKDGRTYVKQIINGKAYMVPQGK